MGKTNRKKNVDEPDVVNVENKKIQKHKNVLRNCDLSTEDCLKRKRIKKSNKCVSSDDTLSNNSVKSKKKNKNQGLNTFTSAVDYNVPQDKMKKKKKQTVAQNESISQNLEETGIYNNNNSVKKRKLSVVAEQVAVKGNKPKNLAEADSNKNNNKIIQSTVPEKVSNSEESHEGVLKNTSKISKKEKLQQHEEVHHTVQSNDINEKRKKKKKRKIVDEEIIADEEIDRYCDELDEADNKRYENWVKLVEENLNKNAKKYL